MVHEQPTWNADESLLWNLLGIVELSYHPALAVTLLAAIHVVFSPIPGISLHPMSITQTGRGVPITTFFASIVVVDLVRDVIGVYASGWGTTPEEHDR